MVRLYHSYSKDLWLYDTADDSNIFVETTIRWDTVRMYETMFPTHKKSTLTQIEDFYQVIMNFDFF